jgi:hypothetical protein
MDRNRNTTSAFTSRGVRAYTIGPHGNGMLYGVLKCDPCQVQVSITKRTEPHPSTALFSGFLFPSGGKLLEVSHELFHHEQASYTRPM